MARYPDRKNFYLSKQKIDNHIIKAKRNDDDKSIIYEIQDSIHRWLVITL